MLHPSYTDLMKVVNQDVEEGATKIVNSRYSIVLATAKRARQIIDGEMPLVPVKDGEKPLSIAIDELNSGKIKIIADSYDRGFYFPVKMISPAAQKLCLRRNLFYEYIIHFIRL